MANRRKENICLPKKNTHRKRISHADEVYPTENQLITIRFHKLWAIVTSNPSVYDVPFTSHVNTAEAHLLSWVISSDTKNLFASFEEICFRFRSMFYILIFPDFTHLHVVCYCKQWERLLPLVRCHRLTYILHCGALREMLKHHAPLHIIVSVLYVLLNN